MDGVTRRAENAAVAQSVRQTARFRSDPLGRDAAKPTEDRDGRFGCAYLWWPQPLQKRADEASGPGGRKGVAIEKGSRRASATNAESRAPLTAPKAALLPHHSLEQATTSDPELLFGRGMGG
eukprot:scaffold8090_cov267-Pinguiococcus_pyrenoidosus.AAC.10